MCGPGPFCEEAVFGDIGEGSLGALVQQSEGLFIRVAAVYKVVDERVVVDVMVLDFGKFFGDNIQGVETLFESFRSVASKGKDLE